MEFYVQMRSIKQTREMFANRFPNLPIPAKLTIQWRATGSGANAPKNIPAPVRTPELTSRIQEMMTRSPRKSTRRLALQVGASDRTCRRVLHQLHMRAYHMTVVHELKQPDKVKLVRYCNWLNQMIVDGRLDPTLVYEC